MEVRRPKPDLELVEKIHTARAKIDAEMEASWKDLNEKILRASKSWNRDYPGRKELPRWIAVICQIAVRQAGRNGTRPAEELDCAARLRGRLPEEAMDILLDWCPPESPRSTTTIQIRQSTRARLGDRASHDDTMDDVITRLLDGSE